MRSSDISAPSRLSSLRLTAFAALSLAAIACSPDGGPESQNPAQSTEPATTSKQATGPQLSIPFEKYVLENGLEVILHVDKSDPVVAIDLAAHVGSSHEVENRTGFAHLFEHLLFLDSENLGFGGLDEMNTRIGGEGTNGFTTNDMTQYFQAVPADALEKIIWAEADKLGWFINTVTQPVLDNEKQVVKNEKRQRVDNAPYGHLFYVIGKALYPEDHPYNWQVIGSLADLDAATLQDVKDFYRRWYVPNNVTVTISGDFDPAEAKRLVEKYFGEIPRGEDIAARTPRPGVLEHSASYYHEDNFAQVPQLTMVWPTIEEYHADSYALDILSTYLTDGKRAPLNEVLIDEEKLTSGVSAFNFTKELAGEFYVSINANADQDLDAIVPALERGFARFEENGIPQSDLDRIKAGLEVDFYGQIQSALGKAIQLGEYNIFTGDPGFISKDIENLLAVTPDDVMRVYNKYIKDKSVIMTSFVPRGQTSLIVNEGIEPQKAIVVEEAIVQGAEQNIDFDPTVRNFDRTPSAFDRSQEPDFGPAYTLPDPVVWRAGDEDGVRYFGIENDETPLVYFSLAIDAGRNRASAEKPAVANLTADMLEKGTATKTTAELEDAIQSLGSSISIFANSNGTFITGSTLSRNFDKTIALVEEMLLEPRWDEEEFDLLIRATNNSIDQAAAQPGSISQREAAKLSYPDDHILHYQPYGTKEKLANVSIDDLKQFYTDNYHVKGVRFRVAGNIRQEDIVNRISQIERRWSAQASNDARVEITLAQPRPVDSSKVYFYDVPDSKQSVLRIFRPSLDALDPDYPLANAANFLLGNIYTSRLNTELRVNRGYTYGIRSGFNAEKDRGSFVIASSVRSNVTLESADLIREIVANYGPSFTKSDLDIMKGALLRGQALATETLDSKLSMIGQISAYGYPDDYLKQNAARIDAMDLAEFKRVTQTYMRPDAMNWLVVGDAATQAERLNDLGFGETVLLPTGQQ